jgi:hypothetical protein
MVFLFEHSVSPQSHPDIWRYLKLAAKAAVLVTLRCGPLPISGSRMLCLGSPDGYGVAACARAFARDSSCGRYYDPGLGRFISTDPIAGVPFSNSANLYSYAQNRPTVANDPSGLITDRGQRCSSGGTSNPRSLFAQCVGVGTGRAAWRHRSLASRSGPSGVSDRPRFRPPVGKHRPALRTRPPQAVIFARPGRIELHVHHAGTEHPDQPPGTVRIGLLARLAYPQRFARRGDSAAHASDVEPQRSVLDASKLTRDNAHFIQYIA